MDDIQDVSTWTVGRKVNFLAQGEEGLSNRTDPLLGYGPRKHYNLQVWLFYLKFVLVTFIKQYNVM